MWIEGSVLLFQMIRLDENDTKTKLETLFKKNLYPTAINLARSQAYNDGLIDIFTQYGDHLYRYAAVGVAAAAVRGVYFCCGNDHHNICSKGDFDGAITQYILTIGKLEPSYVIRKVSS
jgi:hypothetical protein